MALDVLALAGIDDIAAAIAVMEIKGCKNETVLELVDAGRDGAHAAQRKEVPDGG